ncbi:hypothetical protein BT96DRAFT_630947 [Gymnopus androsaceus JB14]|uniref:Fungal N-terminal domain-containing protein n=1 Tax=Gymnopus androsaceus JB14 TaxID=1447944 RepID=A0A6A4HSZ6_9AGAR|nr:hypothetical protein BT96DRAFT_630947 [Gymnopus androsaceus JB14]
MDCSISNQAACLVLLVSQLPSTLALPVAVAFTIAPRTLGYMCGYVPTVKRSLESLEKTIGVMEDVLKNHSGNCVHNDDVQYRLKRLREQQNFLQARHRLLLGGDYASWKHSYFFSLWVLFQQVQKVRNQARSLRDVLLSDIETEYESRFNSDTSSDRKSCCV